MSDKNLKNGYVYTHDEAAKILDKIDDVLVKYDIRVPSPEDEDDDRHETGLHGSTYDELFNYVEDRLKAIIKVVQTGNYVIIPDKFSGNY